MKMYPFIKFLAYVIAAIIVILEWYKGGIQSVIVLGVLYIFGIFIASLWKEVKGKE